jgi:tetratricopeptide (TPR) repeat protein
MSPTRRFAQIGWLAAGLAAIVGCRLHRGAETASRSLVQCRQLSQQGLRALEHNHLAQAESLLSQAVEACPADAEARRHYAEALWRLRKQHEALSQLDEAVRLSSEDSGLLAHAAQMRLALGHTGQASELAERAIDFDPKNGAAWAVRGQVRRRAGKLRQALADLQRASGLEPDNRQVMQEIAEVYQELQQPQQSLAAWQSLCDAYPPGEEPQRVIYLTGLAYNAVGRPADAVECLRAAQHRGPATPELLFHLADAELRAGRREEARATARRALQLQPGHAPSLALMERLELAQGRAEAQPR